MWPVSAVFLFPVMGTWIKDAGHAGQRPDCEKVAVQTNGNAYVYGPLERCKLKCEQESTGTCNVVSRYEQNNKLDTSNWHCYTYACTHVERVRWVAQTSWGQGADGATAHFRLFEQNQPNGANRTQWVNRTRWVNRLRWVNSIRWINKTRWWNRTWDPLRWRNRTYRNDRAPNDKEEADDGVVEERTVAATNDSAFMFMIVLCTTVAVVLCYKECRRGSNGASLRPPTLEMMVVDAVPVVVAGQNMYAEAVLADRTEHT